MGTEVDKDIEAMLNALGDPTPEGATVKEEEHEEEIPPEKKEDEKEEEASEEKEEEKKEEEKKEEEPDKDKIIESLRKQLNEKSGTPLVKEKTKEEIEKDKTDEAARLKAEEDAHRKDEDLKLEDQDFVGELDLDEITRDKTVLNKLLNSVYSKGVADSKKISTEGVLRSLPDIVKHNLTLLTTLKEASDNFYKENKDLTPFKKVVAAVFEEIASINPDKKYDELMKLVAPEARKRLELHKAATKKKDKDGNDVDDGKSPRLPSKKGGQRLTSTKPNTSPMQDEIASMNKILGR